MLVNQPIGQNEPPSAPFGRREAGRAAYANFQGPISDSTPAPVGVTLNAAV